MERTKEYETDHLGNRPLYSQEDIKKFEGEINFLKKDKAFPEIFCAVSKKYKNFNEVNSYFQAARLSGPGKKFRPCMDGLEKLGLVKGYGGIENNYKGFKRYEITERGRKFVPIFINEVPTTS